MEKCNKCLGCIVVLILIIMFFFIPPKPIEEEPEVKTYRFKDLGIVSAKKPFNTHLWWEHTTYGLVLVDSADQTKLFISTDKGDNWSEIDLSDNTNTYKIQAGWLDGNDLWLVMCDNPGNDFEVCFIELDDSNDCNPIAVSVGQDAGTVYTIDIFKIGTDHYVCNYEERAGTEYIVIWDVDAAFVEKDNNITLINAFINGGYGLVISNVYYIAITLDTVPDPVATHLFSYTSATSTLALEDQYAAYRVNTTVPNLKGTSYDGSDIIQLILEKVADGKNYLHDYTISTPDFTLRAEYNVALQLDRNNAGTIPNEFEKGFGIVNEIVYEIKPKRGGIIQLQNCSELSDANLIAITDNFLMNDDGDMFEFTEVSREITSISYRGGII